MKNKITHRNSMNRREFLKQSLVATTGAAAVSSFEEAHLLARQMVNVHATSTRLPNIVLIYTDDHAQWAVGAYGNKDVHTPNIDRLAAQGMRFTQGFTKPVCSPSRAMLLTGQYSHRVGIPDYIRYGHGGNGLPAGTATIASVLKDTSYATGLVGKWHLGYGEKYYPELFGFNHAECYQYVAPGKPYGTRLTFLIDGKEEGRLKSDRTSILADRAIHFIRSNREKPFFLFLSIYRPHLAWLPVPDEDLAHYKGRPLTVPDLSRFPDVEVSEEKLRELTGLYYANITCADRNMGRIFDVLDELKLTDNTIVIFIGDNGFNVGHHGLLGKGNARFLYIDEQDRISRAKGTRPNMFDRSVLVPFIIRWPGTVKPGTTSDALVSTIDILPTVMDVTGAGARRKLQLDGQSLLPILKGEREIAWRDAYCDTYDMIYLVEAHMRMIRTDQWKLVLYFPPEYRRDKDGRPLAYGNPHELFNLREDPEELNNIYGQESVRNIQEQLEQRLYAWMRETRA